MSEDAFEMKIREAREKGLVKIDDPSGAYMIVAPRARNATAPEPFGSTVQNLLQMPTGRPAYSDRTAWLMAELSQLAYHQFEKHPETETLLCEALSDAGFVLRATFDEQTTGTQAFLTQRPEEFAVLAFRGTEENARDIVTDMDARFYDTPDGKAHAGFKKAYDSLSRSIKKELDQLPAGTPLYICGHSLGGALATVATQHLEESCSIAATYTFGSPRVGVPEWSDAIKTPIYRIVNGADVVPLVPPGVALKTALLFVGKVLSVGLIQKFVKQGFVGFQHAGDIRFLGGSLEEPKLKAGTAVGHRRLQSFWNWLVFFIRQRSKGSLTKGIADHSIGRYAAKLRVIAQRRNL